MGKQTKNADIPIDYRTAARFGVGGLVTGGSIAALLSLVHELREAKQKRVASQRPDDENTLTLTLPPPKTAAVKEDKPCKVKRVAMSKSTVSVATNKGNNKSVSQLRYAIDGHKGRFGPNLCKSGANWQTMVASTLAAGGSGILGYKLVSKLNEKRRLRQLGEELESAKREYIDRLTTGAPKVATALDTAFDIIPNEKAAVDQWGPLQSVYGAVALLTLLGSGATAYITKKIMDKKLKERENEGFDPPKLNRIVFRTAPTAPAAKTAEHEEPCTPEDIEAIKAALVITMDMLSGKEASLSDTRVVVEMRKVGTTVPELYNTAQNSVEELIALLQQQPQFRKALLRAGMAQHPTLKNFKFLASIPGVRGILAKKMYGKLRSGAAFSSDGSRKEQLSGTPEGTPGLPQFGDISKLGPIPTYGVSTPGKVPIHQTKWYGMLPPNMLVNPVKAATCKQAVMGLSPLGIASSFVGSSLAEQDNAAAPAKPTAKPTAGKRKDLDDAQIQRILARIKVQAADPDAKAFVSTNREQLMRILQQMAREGTLTA